MDASALKKLSVAELSHFLTEKGIPATAFEGIAYYVVPVHRSSCNVFLFYDVKKMVPPIGLAKKICALIPVVSEQHQIA